MSTKPGPLADAGAGTALSGARVKVGHLASGSTPAELLVDFDGSAAGPVVARSVLTLDEAAIAGAVAGRRPVVLLFENEDPKLPIIVGMLTPDPGASLLHSLLQAPAATTASPSKPVEARVDGKRVVLEGDQEVVLRCGEASITLRRDGKVVVRGTYIETTAKGVNRIRGGSVKIN
jgi:Domain of unknown function (DUF6484)